MVHLGALFEHPLKSGRGNPVTWAEVRPEGLAHDRRFMVYAPDGTFLSGRSHPGLVLVEVDWQGAMVRFSAPGVPALDLDPVAAQEVSVAVWKDRFPAWDQGEAPARWFSQVLGDEVRLAWLGQSRRSLRWDRGRVVTFADAAPLLAIGTASLDDLSRRVGEALSMRRFRPNLVIEGAEPFEEDSWRRLRIGDVEFLNLDGCSRCEFTTIDPETGQRHPRGEPVATLESYRKNDVGIYFGMNLMPLCGGVVRIGDPVTVVDRRRPLSFGVPISFSPSREAPWPEGPAPLVCTRVTDEVPGVKTFQFVRQDGRTFSWDAGQALTLQIPSPGPDGEFFLRRSYSLSSAPGSPPQITVKRLDDGHSSRWLHDRLVPGGVVVADGVGGSFTLQAHPWPSVLFLGAGSGVTPLIALLRWITAEDFPIDVAFHQSARTREELLFLPELERIKAQRGDRLTLGTRVTSEQGRLDYQGLVGFCPDLRDRRIFACGPRGFRSSLRGYLAEAGCKVDRRYHEESYGDEPQDPEAGGTVVFCRSGRSVASDGRTVLQLAEGLGIEVPSSCRAGDCGICRVWTTSGQAILACQSVPRTDLSLDL